jgi:hypothetical protein
VPENNVMPSTNVAKTRCEQFGVLISPAALKPE